MVMDLWQKAWRNVMQRPSRSRYEIAKRALAGDAEEWWEKVIQTALNNQPGARYAEASRELNELCRHVVEEYEKPEGTLVDVAREHARLRRLLREWREQNAA